MEISRLLTESVVHAVPLYRQDRLLHTGLIHRQLERVRIQADDLIKWHDVFLFPMGVAQAVG